MSYIKNLDVEIRETVGKIADVVARHFPESEYEDGNWEAEIAYLVRGLANTVLKTGISEAHQQEINGLKGGRDGNMPEVPQGD